MKIRDSLFTQVVVSHGRCAVETSSRGKKIDFGHLNFTFYPILKKTLVLFHFLS